MGWVGQATRTFLQESRQVFNDPRNDVIFILSWQGSVKQKQSYIATVLLAQIVKNPFWWEIVPNILE